MSGRLLTALLLAASNANAVDLTGYVLTNMGDTSGGNDFPGVAQPYGMVKLGPDLYDGSDSYSGYDADGNFTGFSMMHESGTGGAPKYGVVSQMPVLGNITNPLADHNDTRLGTDVTSVGYYKASMGSGIVVELAATSRAGLYQYSFPPDKEANVIIDVSHVLPSYRGLGWSQSYLGGNITIAEDGHYEGFGDYNGGWNLAPEWRIFFCGYFSQPASSTKTFLGTNELGSMLAQYNDTTSFNSTARLGAVYSFGTNNVTSRVGISFISSAQACSNVNSQIPDGTSLSTVTDATKDVWNTRILNKVTTPSTNTTMLQMLYTSMYHMNLLPSNRTGENPLWDSPEPYYDDTFTLWDLFRCTTPLFHILSPSTYTEFINSLLNIYTHVEYMPDARSSNWNGATQGGSNADNVLADAFIKGIGVSDGSVKWTTGYAAMVKDAEITPPNNHDPRDATGATNQGRGALPDWLEYGYITPSYGRSVSRAVEYSVNDFALYQVASGLNLSSDSAKYLNRSRNWRYHWNPKATSLGFSGFVVPRKANGAFIAQNPLSCGGCYWTNYYYEGLPWEYSFNAHHDISHLISLSGGNDTFVERLNTMFTPGLNTGGSGSSAYNYTIFNSGNEPSFTTPYLYNFVNRQDLSVKESRYAANAYYAPSPSGLPGNSDAGAMQSWLLWNMLGLYSMTGQTTFLIGSPWMNYTLDLEDGKKLEVTVVLGGEGNREDAVAGEGEAIYVQSLKVNGESWDKGWVTWDDVFANGGRMDFVLGETARNWTTGETPPSPAS